MTNNNIRSETSAQSIWFYREGQEAPLRHKSSADISDISDISAIGDYLDPSIIRQVRKPENLHENEIPTLPTLLPTHKQSSQPSIMPSTRMPSNIPTFYPSTFPSQLPTTISTNKPSSSPSVSQTEYPSLKPTLSRTINPSSYNITAELSSRHVNNSLFTLTFMKKTNVLTTYYDLSDSMYADELLNITSTYLRQMYSESLKELWDFVNLSLSIYTGRRNIRLLESSTADTDYVIFGSVSFEVSASFLSADNVPTILLLDGVLEKSFEANNKERYVDLLRMNTFENGTKFTILDTVIFSFLKNGENSLAPTHISNFNPNINAKPQRDQYLTATLILLCMVAMTIGLIIYAFKGVIFDLGKSKSSHTHDTSSTTTSIYLNEMERCAHGRILPDHTGAETEVVLYNSRRDLDYLDSFDDDYTDEEETEATESFNSTDSTAIFWNESCNTIPEDCSVPVHDSFDSKDTKKTDAIHTSVLANYFKITSAN